MNNLQYEFLTYECFPDDPYIKEVVEVLIGGSIILPYQHIKMKDGGSFWSWCGCGATRDGVKKRFNGEFDSKTLKRKFEADLENFIKTRFSALANTTYHPNQFGSATGLQTSNFSTSQTQSEPVGGVVDQNLPF